MTEVNESHEQEPEGSSQQDTNTRLWVGMAMATGATGWVPIPMAAGWAVTRLRELLVKQLSRRHGVELVSGVSAVIAGSSAPTSGDIALDVVKAALLRDVRKAVRTLPLMFRFGDVLRTLVLGAYFERYCHEHHEGQEIDLEEARRLRKALDEAAEQALASAAGGLLKHVAKELLQLILSVPKALWSLLKEALSKGDEAAERVIEEDSSGLFGRAARAVEGALSSASAAAVAGFYDAFDKSYEAAAAPAEE